MNYYRRRCQLARSRRLDFKHKTPTVASVWSRPASRVALCNKCSASEATAPERQDARVVPNHVFPPPFARLVSHCARKVEYCA